MLLIGRQDRIPFLFRFMVNGLKFRVRLKPRQCAAHTFAPIYFAIVFRHKAFDLAVIKHHAIGFIADQATNGMVIEPRNKI